MQLDMHYYGTYAMARTAGLKPGVCRTIATAAQFVDDNAAAVNIEFQDGGRIDAEATAHHVSDILRNRDPEDQRQVWVPFHFLPGNQGDGFSERLLCREDSPLMRAMVDHHLEWAGHPAGVCLIGIAAHVCADTFSHFGFSGVGSRYNKVDNDSFEFDPGLDPDIKDYIQKKADSFFWRYGRSGGLIANVKSWLAETVSGALGHGAVATYPDRPYLKWSFTYEYPRKRRETRDNPKHFLKGCEALHAMFERFGAGNPARAAGDGIAFGTMKNAVAGILACEAPKAERVKRWRRAAKQGELGRSFSIPLYKPATWMLESARLASSEKSSAALAKKLYRFYQAASIHRQFVLRELLPDNKLVVA